MGAEPLEDLKLGFEQICIVEKLLSLGQEDGWQAGVRGTEDGGGHSGRKQGTSNIGPGSGDNGEASWGRLSGGIPSICLCVRKAG